MVMSGPSSSRRSSGIHGARGAKISLRMPRVPELELVIGDASMAPPEASSVCAGE